MRENPEQDSDLRSMVEGGGGQNGNGGFWLDIQKTVFAERVTQQWTGCSEGLADWSEFSADSVWAATEPETCPGPFRPEGFYESVTARVTEGGADLRN